MLSTPSSSPSGSCRQAPLRRGLHLTGLALLILLLGWPGSSLAQSPEPPEKGTEGLSPLISKALQIIDTLYLHPAAVDPKRMLRAAVQGTEHMDPAILVTEQGVDKLLLQASGQRWILNTDVVDLREMELRLDQALDFLSTARLSEEVDRDQLEQAALRGLLRTIDRHSRLFAGNSLDEFNTRFKGTLVGIGSTIGKRGGKMRIIRPFPDAPAGRAGLKPSDHITHVDGVSTAGLTVEETVDRIRGPKGMPVVLTIVRGEEPGPRIFVLVREKVLVPSIESELLAGDVGLIRIERFSQKTSAEFERHLTELQQGRRLAGVVLDLRGNTGGSMRHASRIVNFFVEQGTIIRTEGHDGQPVSRLTPRIDAQTERLRYSGPVVTLIDRRTASGAEIVAGALKMMGRSLTLGAQSYGKGTVQKIYPLRKSGEKVSMKLTVARYLLPEETFVNGVGVTPDIALGTLWLDPDQVVLPDDFREPAELRGEGSGRGGLDGRRNPGAGREQATSGINSAPVMNLLSARVLEGWAPGEATTESPESKPRQVTSQAETNSAPGVSDLPGDAGEDRFNDMDLRLAHEVILTAQGNATREQLIALARPQVRHWQQVQGGRLTTLAKSRSIPLDAGKNPGWMRRSPGTEQQVRKRLLAPPPQLDAELLLPEQLEAGEETRVIVRVRNTGSVPVQGLRARLHSSSRVLDDIDFLLGDLEPGQKRESGVPISVYRGAPSRLDPWRLYLIDAQGPLGGPYQGTARTLGEARPQLALKVLSQTTTEPGGGTRIDCNVQVRNQGQGRSGELRVQFGRPEDEGVELLEQFQSIEGLNPAQQGEVQLSLRVRDPEALPQLHLRLRARDRSTGVSSTLELELPSSGAGADTGWREPARITMGFPYDRAGDPPARAAGPFTIHGEVESGAGLDWAELRLGRDKLWTASAATSPERHQSHRWELRSPATPELGPNRITVRAHSLSGITSTREFWVLGEVAKP